MTTASQSHVASRDSGDCLIQLAHFPDEKIGPERGHNVPQVTQQAGGVDRGPQTLNLESEHPCAQLTYICRRAVCVSVILWVASRLGRGEEEMGDLKTRAVLNEAFGKVWGWAGNRVLICHAGHVVVGWRVSGVVGVFRGLRAEEGWAGDMR